MEQVNAMVTRREEVLQTKLSANPRPALLKIIVMILRLAIGFTFLLSSVPKLVAPYLFLSSVLSYELVPGIAAKIIAIVLPWLELVIAAMFITNVAIPACFFVSIILCVMFTVVQSIAIHKGLFIPCGCFGEATQQGSSVGYFSLARTGSLLAFSLIGVIIINRDTKLSPRLEVTQC